MAAVLDLSGFPDGTPVAEMAAALGVIIREVRHWVVPDPPLGGRRPDLDNAEIVALRAAGWTQPDIAERFGCSEATISRRLRQARTADGAA